jgi:hypothetical protein
MARSNRESAEDLLDDDAPVALLSAAYGASVAAYTIVDTPRCDAIWQPRNRHGAAVRGKMLTIQCRILLNGL